VLVILGAILLGVLLVRAVVPVLWNQATRLVESLPAVRGYAETRLLPWLKAHPHVQERVHHALESVDPMAILKEIGVAGVNVLGWLLDLIELILVPLILYYLLVEGPVLHQAVGDLVPPRHRAWAKGLTDELNRRLGGYIRGQLAVSVVMTLLQGLGFRIVGVPYPWLLGLVAGFSNVVPYSPYVTALLPAILFSALGGAGGYHLLTVGVVFTLIQKLETFHFTPVWVGRASGLHPLEVLLAILCFGYAFGIPGLIFAVPLMILLKVAASAAVARYKAHPWFTGDASRKG
jgi:predicted PurR-regulated permease PerM